MRVGIIGCGNISDVYGDVVAFKMGRRRDPAVEHFDAFSQRVAR